MRIKLFVAFLMVSMLLSWFGMPVTSRAQTPGPSRPEKPGIPALTEHGTLPLTDTLAPQASDAVSLGAPSISYRFVQSFGHTDQAYLDDNSHFAFPMGAFANGSGVWIAESEGKRALKYNNAGIFQRKIGIAGLRTSYEAAEIDIEWPADAVEDSAGNLWIVDAGTRSALQFNSAGEYVRMIGEQWNTGSDNNHFDNPYGIAVDSANNVYISDRRNHRIQIYTSTGSYLATIGITDSPGSDDTRFNSPYHIAIDAANRLYIADANNHRIQIFNVATPTAAAYLGTIGVSGSSGSGTGKLRYPRGVAVDASYIYVADSGNGRVQVFNRATWAYVATIGAYGSGDGQYWWPVDVAADGAGNVWVVDADMQRVEQYSFTTFTRHLGQANLPYLTTTEHYNTPSDVAAWRDGSLLVVEGAGRRITKHNPNGTFAWAVGQAGVNGSDNAHFDWPNAAAIDAAGNAYVVDSGNQRVQIYSSAGGYVATLGQTGTAGAANNQFDNPLGVAIDTLGRIYVTDANNYRVQVFNSDRTYLATLGVTGVSGSDNAHFAWPSDVAVAPDGTIYVVDQDNQRVQVFNANRSYQRTIGVTGSANSGMYDRLGNPPALVVDGYGRVFIADSWGNHVHVYDNTGKFLTIIGDYWGTGPGQLRQYNGLGTDSQGNIYGADGIAHRIDKWSTGLPGYNGHLGWAPLNVNGMGEYRSWGASAMEVVSDTLYVGDITYYYGANIWKYDATGAWTKIATAGIGDSTNYGIDDLQAFHGYLYAGTWNEDSGGSTHGGQVWRHPLDDSANWDLVVDSGFGNLDNGEVVSLANFSNTLYAATWSWNTAHSSEIYRSTSGNVSTWNKVFDETDAGDVYNQAVMTMKVFDNKLYAGTYNSHSGGKIWATSDGDTWSQVNLSGFGVISNTMIHDMQVFNGYLYASAYNSAQGGQVWRSSNGTDWTKVVDHGLTGVANRSFTLESDGTRLYLISRNWDTGSEVWVSTTGDEGSYEAVMINGWGAYKTSWVHWPGQSAIFNGDLVVSVNAWNRAGWRAWIQHDNQIFVPIMRK